jgi:large subunit ribosomal protein L4
VFGPLPRDYSYHMPAKARRVALRTALCGKLADGEVCLFDPSAFGAPSAKAARALLADLDSPRRAVVVTTERNDTVVKSFRNFPRVTVRNATDLCAFDVAAGGLVVIEEGALSALEERVGARAAEGAKS